MKFFHEAPIFIFQDVQEVTDGDYALVHLFEENEQYLDLFIEAVHKGREVILDNSIFELGEAFEKDKFANWVEYLKPSWYIIPDSLENCEKTVSNLHEWVFDPYLKKLPGKKIGVVQGRNKQEIEFCYNQIQPFVDMVAISFDYDFLQQGYIDKKEYNFMFGRVDLLRDMDRYVNRSKPHHLLGVYLPQEGKQYTHRIKEWLYSIDTSNPVVHGLHNEYYSADGLNHKKSVTLFTMISEAVSLGKYTHVMHNIRKFKEFWS